MVRIFLWGRPLIERAFLANGPDPRMGRLPLQNFFEIDNIGYLDGPASLKEDNLERQLFDPILYFDGFFIHTLSQDLLLLAYFERL